MGNEYVDIEFPGDCAKLIIDEPPSNGNVVVLRTYLNQPFNRDVVKRPEDGKIEKKLEDWQKIPKEIDQAVYEELKTLINHKCFI